MIHVRPMIEADIAVVITCHRYEQFLPAAIRSVLGQSIVPKEIVVIDDSPATDVCRQTAHAAPKIRYCRVDVGNPFAARRAGFQATTAQYLCFLDADDKLGPGYLERGLQAIKEDRRAAIASSDIQRFGDSSRLQAWQPQLPAKRIYQTNFLHVGCIVSRDAITVSEAFEQSPSPDCHEDWQFWRAIITAGFRHVKQPALYHARMHGENRSAKIEQGGYYALRGIAQSSITFAPLNPLPVTGLWPRQQSAWHWITNNGLKSTTRRKLLPPDSDAAFTTCAGDGDLFAARALNHALRASNSDYLCIFRTPLSADDLSRLLHALDHRVAMVQLADREFLDGTIIVRPVVADHAYSHRPSLEASLRSKLDKHVELIKTA